MSAAPEGRRLRRRLLAPAGVFAATLLLHSAVNLFVFRGEVFFQKYLQAAERCVDGGLRGERLLDYSPLYLAFHVAVRSVTENPVPFVQAAQNAAVALSAALLYLALADRFPPPFALAGSLLFALNGSVMVYQRIFEPECLLMFFLSAFLFFAPKEGRGHTAAAGLCFALAFLTRANFILVLPAVPLFYLARGDRGRGLLLRCALFFAPVATAICLLAAVNSSVAGSFTPFSANPGQVFFEGNNPNSAGESGAYPPLVNDLAAEFPGEADYHHAVYRLVARRVTGKALSVVEVNRFWSRKAVAFIADHPGHFLRQALFKARLFFHRYRRHDLLPARRMDVDLRGSGLPEVPFWILSGLAVAGLIGAARRWRGDLLYAAVFLAQFATLLLIYVSDRQRVVVLPLFAFFAVQGLHYASSGRRRALTALLVTALAYPLFGAPIDTEAFEGRQLDTVEEVRLVLDRLKTFRAERRVGEAGGEAAALFSLAPWIDEVFRPAGLPLPLPALFGDALERAEKRGGGHPYDRFRLALLRMDAGDLDGAAEILGTFAGEGARFYQIFGASSSPDYYLGRIEEMRGDVDGAVALYRKALRSFPGSPFSLSRLYALTGEERYREMLRRYFDDGDAAFFVGKAFFGLGRYDRAEPYLRYVTGLFPEFTFGLIYHALTLGALDRVDEGARLYVSAMGRSMEPTCCEEMAVDLFDRWAAGGGDGEALYYYGVVLHQFGRYEKALEVQREALRLLPYEEAVRYEIRELEETLSALRRAAG